MTDKHITIPRGKTHRDTATAIYEYLRDNPDQWPSDDANRNGTGHYALVVRLDGTESAIKITELTQGSFAAFPAIAGDAYTSTGDYIGTGAVFHGYHLIGIAGHDEDVTDPEWVIKCLRLVSMRIDRYQAKKQRRQDAYDALYANA